MASAEIPSAKTAATPVRILYLSFTIELPSRLRSLTMNPRLSARWHMRRSTAGERRVTAGGDEWRPWGWGEGARHPGESPPCSIVAPWHPRRYHPRPASHASSRGPDCASRSRYRRPLAFCSAIDNDTATIIVIVARHHRGQRHPVRVRIVRALAEAPAEMAAAHRAAAHRYRAGHTDVRRRLHIG